MKPFNVQAGLVGLFFSADRRLPTHWAAHSFDPRAAACWCVNGIAAQSTTTSGRHGRESRFRCLFSFPVFINKSARKKDAVVDRTDLSPKFPLPPHRTNSRSVPDPCRAPPRLPDPDPDLLAARRGLSIGTSFTPSL